ncbi:MAG: GAF domain-containing protein [Candidatus Latescibacterota bacterium]
MYHKNLQEALVCVAEAFYAHHSEEDILAKAGQIIKKWIPCDHMKFVMPVVGKQYDLSLDGFVEYRRFTPQDWQMGDRHSAVHWVLYHQLPILRPNVADDLRFEVDEKRVPEGLVAQLVVPLVSDDECVGVLNFISKTPHVFTNSHVETAQLFARLVATGIQQIYLRKEMQGIGEISRAIQMTSDLNQILNLILEHIRSLGYDRVRVYLYDESALLHKRKS